MRKMKPRIGDFYKVPNPGLWAYFKHVVSGNTEDYRPPFWNKMDRSKVLQLWQDRVDAIGVKENYPELYSFEMDMKSKVGPMSIQEPLEQRFSKIEEYYTCIENAGEPIDRAAIIDTFHFFRKAAGIRLRTDYHVVENMRLNTNSGSWLFEKRRVALEDTLSANYQYSDNKAIATILTCGGGRWLKEQYELVATLGWRGQEGGLDDDDVKQRVVFMMPFLLNIKELQFYQPAIEAMQKNKLIPAYISMDCVDEEVTALFDTKGKDDLVICTDFTGFDQHFNINMQNAARDVEEFLSTRDDRCKWWFRNVYDVKFHIPLVCSEDIMYRGHHGMGSGSGGTNFDECMAHKALQFEAAYRAHSTLNPHSMAYGDDGILTYPGIKVDDVIRAYTSHGLEMNASKQYVSTHDCVVLRRWHGTNYRVNGTMVGVYSTFRALGRLLAQERFYDPEKWSKEMVILRALSILENCKWSPYFHEFIDFVIEGDKYRLGLSIPGFFNNLKKLAKEAIETFTDFLGYTKTIQQTPQRAADGIVNWEVVKYLMSKAK